MTNQNAIETIIKFIDYNNLRKMKNWGLRHPRQKNLPSLKTKIRSVLELFSGNNIVAMLKG